MFIGDVMYPSQARCRWDSQRFGSTPRKSGLLRRQPELEVDPFDGRPPQHPARGRPPRPRPVLAAWSSSGKFRLAVIRLLTPPIARA